MTRVFSEIETHLLSIVRSFLIELGAERNLRGVILNASLENDLGLTSLERAELFRRLEQEFHIQFPDSLIMEADTLKDVVDAIEKTKPVKHSRSRQFEAPLETANVDLNNCETLIDVLAEYAEKEPNRPHIYYQNDEGNEEIISYGQLNEIALRVATALPIEPGETVAIMLPTSKEFFYAFFGILLAGGIPVPIYPPFRQDQIEDYAIREANILNNAGVKILITFHQAENISRILKSFIPTLKKVITIPALLKLKGLIPKLKILGDSPALIQYTSGSTGTPKGVLLSHSNLITNIRSFGKVAKINHKDVAVSWLPLYHDMGLIGAWFGSLYHGIPLTIFSPLSFIARPERWLWNIHYHQATISGGPNFGYEFCVKKITPEMIEGLDLSSWRIAFNGAEAINPKTLERFAKKFAPYGFKEESLFPVYGLAESTVGLTLPPINRKPKIDHVDRTRFEKESVAEPVQQKKSAIDFVSCGKPLPKHYIQVVDQNQKVLDERYVGQLQFKGPSTMQGYFANPEATDAIFHDDWWDTGDLAYIADGEVYLTGRSKDLIIKTGRNLYPPEIEELIAEIPDIRKGCVAAFGVSDESTGSEKLVIVAETKQEESEKRKELKKVIIKKTIKLLGLAPDDVVLLTPGQIQKTSSGKLRRSACKDLYIKGQLKKVGLHKRWQIIKLIVKSVFSTGSKWISYLIKIIYSLYIYLTIFIMLPIGWFSTFFLSRKYTFNFVQRTLKILFKFYFCPIRISGIENIPKNKASIFVVNHSSYFDSPILLTFLPQNALFIGKIELSELLIVKRFINKLNYLTVDRMDFYQSLEDTEQIQKTLLKGNSIVIFPEGTFTGSAGLRNFKLGAFKLAVETKTPIIPISLKGTRKFYRANQYLFARTPIDIHIDKPIEVKGEGWDEINRLRLITRKKIAKYCGEAMINI